MCQPLLKFGLMLTVVLYTVNGLPNKPDTAREDHPKNIVGQASHIVTNSLLQSHIEAQNFVFSPLGFSSILAILREGARTHTANEIQKVLNFGLATDEEIRLSYEGALKKLSDANAQISPQFKTWFYIYKNNTVEAPFKEIIEKYYSVEVKEIKRFSFDDPSDSDTTTEFTYPADDLEFPNEKEEATKAKTDLSNTFKKLKLAIVKAEENHQKNAIIEKDKISKFDRVVEDKQYKEVSKIKEQMKEEAKETELHTKKKTEKKEVVLNKEVKKEVKVEAPVVPAEKEIEVVPLPLEMRSFAEDDVASALSGNSIVGKDDDKEEPDSTEQQSKMLLFNGLYFRGNWMLPFQQLRASPADVFYNSTSQKTQVTMMRTRGVFKTAFVKSIEAHAVEIPYENQRYALLVVMPKAHSGIAALAKQYTVNTLEEIAGELKEEHLHLALPKFRVETTGRAEKPLAKSGITSLFTRKADLSGISTEQKLHVDELVQHVAVCVDEGAITQNAFSATNAVRSEPLDEELVIDHPFLFFVRDIVDDIVLVAGGVNHVPANKPVTFF